MESLQHFFISLDWACVGVWTLTLTLMIGGVIGAVIPMLPGAPLILLAAVLHVFLRPQSGVTWWCVLVLALLTVLSQAVDFASGAVGARWFGGSRWGTWGVLLGGLAGLFFAFPGIIIGPLAGGFLFEMLFARKQVGPAVKSTWGTIVGTGLGIVLQLVLCLVMIACFFIHAFWL